MREIRDTVRQAGGYILNVAESRRPKLLDARDSGDDVAESVPDFKHPRGYPLICFVSFRDGAITHLAEGRCGHRAGTNLRRLNLVNLNRVGTPVPYQGGLEAVHRMKHTSVVFSGHRVRLTVMMAHRNRLEEQLGADLVYCNETYESFVVVQYKAMEHDGRAAAFRLPNDQLDRELKRMEGLWARFQGSQQDADLDDFRLKENPLFLNSAPA